MITVSGVGLVHYLGPIDKQFAVSDPVWAQSNLDLNARIRLQNQPGRLKFWLRPNPFETFYTPVLNRSSRAYLASAHK